MATYTDQFYIIDPSAPPPAGTALTFVSYTLTDQNNDGDFDRFNNDSVNGSDITSSYPGDTVRVNVPGIGNVTYTGTTFYLANGQVVFTPNDGQALRNGTFVSSTWVSTQGPLLATQLGAPCFTPGTMIRVPGGEAAIETLRPGDLVETLDHGPQELRWIGQTTVDGTDDLAPIRIEKGIFGNRRPLVVSPQHRVLISGWKSELILAAPEVLVPAKHLTGMDGVREEPAEEVHYVHILFDRHEIVFAEGVSCESFHPGSEVIEADRALYREILSVFPELAQLREEERLPVRRTARAHEARLLAM